MIIPDATETSPQARRMALETTTVVDAPRILCASCEWSVPDGYPSAHDAARRHALSNTGHLALVETSRSRQYIVRAVTA